MARIQSSRLLPHTPERVFEFLSDLSNHWQLEDAFIGVNGVRAGGAHILIRGPLGISRRGTPRSSPQLPRRTCARAAVGTRTVGLVAWDIAAAGGGSRVTLSAGVERASLSDRALLVLGGRRWLRRRFEHVLETLGRRLES